MFSDDPLFDRIMWWIIRYVVLPVMLIMFLTIMIFYALSIIELI